MAPYLGLMTVRGIELAGGGYTRKDLSEVRFRISPAEDAGDDLTVLNWDDIPWFRLLEADVVALAVFDDASGPEMITCAAIGPMRVRDGDQLCIAAGMLRFGHKFKDKRERNIDAAADHKTTDRWRQALQQIANAPASARAMALRNIARKALTEVD